MQGKFQQLSLDSNSLHGYILPVLFLLVYVCAHQEHPLIHKSPIHPFSYLLNLSHILHLYLYPSNIFIYISINQSINQSIYCHPFRYPFLVPASKRPQTTCHLHVFEETNCISVHHTVSLNDFNPLWSSMIHEAYMNIRSYCGTCSSEVRHTKYVGLCQWSHGSKLFNRSKDVHKK